MSSIKEEQTRIPLYSKSPKKMSDKIKRNCLRCDKQFMAMNKFRRLCDQCKAYTEKNGD